MHRTWSKKLEVPIIIVFILFFFNCQALLDDKTQWTTRYGCIAGLAELGHDVSLLHLLSTKTVFNALHIKHFYS